MVATVEGSPAPTIGGIPGAAARSPEIAMTRDLVSVQRGCTAAPAICAALAAVATLAPLFGCGDDAKPCIDQSKPALEACNGRADQLQAELNAIKKQLAQALANPGTLQVDPSVMVIDGKLGGGQPALKEGTLSQQEVIRVLTQSKASLRPCYNRALKRDSALHHRKLVLTLALKVKPAGLPDAIALGPNYDDQMIDCMKKAVKRWRFPAFTGTPVGVETPLTFQPKR
jgi:hypothetical protein